MIGIHAGSPDYGRGAGWGTQFSETIGPRETKPLRFPFRIQGPVTDKTRLTLSFYNPAEAEGFDPKSFFLRKQYLGPELERASPAAGQPPPLPRDLAAEAVSVLTAFQNALRAK